MGKNEPNPQTQDLLDDFLDDDAPEAPQPSARGTSTIQTPVSDGQKSDIPSDSTNRSAAAAAVRRYQLRQDSNNPPTSPTHTPTPAPSQPGAEFDDEPDPAPKADDDSDFDFDEPSDTPAPTDKEPKPDDAKAALIARAKEVGLTEQQIKDFEDDLESIVDRRSQLIAPQSETTTPTAPPKVGDPAASAPSQPPAAATADPDFYKSLLDQGYDKTLVDALQQREQRMLNQINERFAQPIRAMQEQSAAVARERLSVAFDSAFNACPENIRGILGTGATDAMPSDSSHRLARELVAQEVNRLHAGYVAAGENPPPLHTLVQKAAKSVFSERIARQREQDLLSKVQPRQNRFTSPPSARNAAPKPASADERSLASINRILAEADAR